MENIGRFQLFRKNAFWSYLGEIIPRIGGLVVVPIWSSRIQPAEFAKWILALGGVEMLLTLTGQVFGTFFMKTLYRFHDEKGEKYFGMGAMATMISTAFIAVIVFFSAEKLSDIWIGEPGYGVLLKIMAGYLIFSQFSRLVRLYLQYKVRFVQLFWVNLVLWASNIGIMLFFLLVFKKGYISWALAALGSEIIIAPICLYLCRDVFWRFWNKRLLSFAVRYGFPSWLNYLMNWGQSRGGRYILSYSGLASGVGLLGIGQNLAGNYLALLRPIRNVSNQVIGHSLESDDSSPHFLEFFHLFSWMATALALVVSMFLGDLMKLLFSKSYHQAMLALPFLIFAACAREIYAIYFSLMFRYFKVWFEMYGGLIGFFVTTAATIALVPRIGFIGAAAAEMVGSILALVFGHVYANRHAPRPFRFVDKFLFLLLAFTFAFVAEFLHVSIVVKIGLASCYLLFHTLFMWARRMELYPLALKRLWGGALA